MITYIAIGVFYVVTLSTAYWLARYSPLGWKWLGTPSFLAISLFVGVVGAVLSALVLRTAMGGMR